MTEREFNIVRTTNDPNPNPNPNPNPDPNPNPSPNPNPHPNPKQARRATPVKAASKPKAKVSKP